MCDNLKITFDEHGIILVNEKKDSAIAKKLTTLLAYLAEIFRKNDIADYHTVASKATLNGKISGHFIIIDVPHQIREKNPNVEQWEIPVDIIQMNSFFYQEMTR